MTAPPFKEFTPHYSTSPNKFHEAPSSMMQDYRSVLWKRLQERSIARNVDFFMSLGMRRTLWGVNVLASNQNICPLKLYFGLPANRARDLCQNNKSFPNNLDEVFEQKLKVALRSNDCLD
jgi:hypothetical protein